MANYPPPVSTPNGRYMDKFQGKNIIILFGKWYDETKHFNLEVARKFYEKYKHIFNCGLYEKKLGDTIVYKVHIASKGHEYLVVHNGNGTWTCGCLGYKYRKDCRHIKAVKEERKNLVM